MESHECEEWHMLINFKLNNNKKKVLTKAMAWKSKVNSCCDHKRMHFSNKFRSWQFKNDLMVWNCFYRDFRFLGRINIFNFSVSANRFWLSVILWSENVRRIPCTNFIDFNLKDQKNCSYWMSCKYQDNLEMIRILSAMLIDIWKLYHAEENANFFLCFFFFFFFFFERFDGIVRGKNLSFSS